MMDRWGGGRRWAAGALAVVTLAATMLGATAQSTITLNGAGSSFDNPLFSKAFAEYAKSNPAVRVNYQSVGSGAGIKQLTQKTVDFGATDAPMTDEQMQAGGGPEAVVHIPVTLGAVAITYNAPGLDQPIDLDGPTLADVFLGTVTNWNDPKIAALNQGVPLPDLPIAVIHRSDGSGTTNIVTTYLASVSPEWKEKVGAGLSVNWPTGIGAKGNEGVAGQVKQLPGAIGYNELAYAHQNNLTAANIENAAGRFVAPSAAGATACANAAAKTMPADLRIMIAGCTGDDAAIYPISGFSWVVLFADQSDPARGKATVDVLNWLIHDGQHYGEALDYAPLPARVVDLATAKLQTIVAGGQPLLTGSPAAATPAA
ncbi:MAG TPA: phosphate ABC transporter substrate-binding protein PstS [Thermomicrobiales bacterium]|nr:phosphate ABC transporter substrate-binding protein PstS [Thermomicrobiales bacterium]